jgi:hypothetical protein
LRLVRIITVNIKKKAWRVKEEALPPDPPWVKNELSAGKILLKEDENNRILRIHEWECEQ